MPDVDVVIANAEKELEKRVQDYRWKVSSYSYKYSNKPEARKLRGEIECLEKLIDNLKEWKEAKSGRVKES